MYAGVDYEAILERAEAEADVVLWDGGNNELPFFVPDVHVVLADPHRPNHERTYHPGETNFRLADYVLINKENTASEADVQTIVDNAAELNPDATIIHADSVVTADDPDAIDGRRVLAVEDGPTLTHGGTSHGAAFVAARQYGASEIVDPREDAVGSIARVYDEHPHIGPVMPAMGYSDEQIEELERSIANVDCDVVLVGTPIDLTGVLEVDTPTVRIRYEIAERGRPTLADVLEKNAGVLGLRE
ncbi:MAG: hypothetical protein ABEJ55_01975 [Halanaeroarchaeum sp.]